nr:MAG TPA: hypothetical protein [Caudoviricetes sp.]
MASFQRGGQAECSYQKSTDQGRSRENGKKSRHPFGRGYRSDG